VPVPAPTVWVHDSVVAVVNAETAPPEAGPTASNATAIAYSSRLVVSS
jgi:hypothetical protein